MSKPNKYYQHISQEPTDGDPNSRAFKRRQWKESWLKYYATENHMDNFSRDVRRSAWQMHKSKFMNTEEVIG